MSIEQSAYEGGACRRLGKREKMEFGGREGSEEPSGCGLNGPQDCGIGLRDRCQQRMMSHSPNGRRGIRAPSEDGGVLAPSGRSG